MKVIEIRNLYKKFAVDINPLTMFNLFKRIVKPEKHIIEIWALNNINFEVHKGDSVAIMGDNGAGKTTLLRIISGLYKKTEGLVNVSGNVATFLQWGSGMERELTVLDNIFLFGVIMGAEKKEIKRKLDDIISFSEIGNFLYYPLKDISSGMMQKLVFSILRCVNFDILLLDEMLTSGDIKFKEKCHRAIEAYQSNSKTMLIISHEMEVIRKFCNKCLLLSKGSQIAYGPTEEVLDIYIKGINR